MASSDGFGRLGERHHLTAFRIEAGSGALAAHGEPVPLPARPIHVCVDALGEYVITAYPRPSSITVHRLDADGRIGAEVTQSSDLDTGIYAHQVRVTPSNRGVVLVTRGNNPTLNTPEDPGALKVMSMVGGQLAARASVAPNDGYGFGPRHLDFHSRSPWVYVSVERQNLLLTFEITADDSRPALPRFASSTLDDPARAGERQGPSAVHVHPNGDVVYVSNRSDISNETAGPGEDDIAVYAIDASNGEPRLIQHVDAHTIHVRTFSIDSSGRLLIAAGLRSNDPPDGAGAQPIAAGLSAFRIDAAGKLEFVRKYEVETEGQLMFWSGMVAPA